MKDFKSTGDALPDVLDALGLDGVSLSVSESKPASGAPVGKARTKEKQSKKVGQFAPVPCAIVNLASKLAESGKARGFAKALKLVTLDLVTYTDWNHDDVIISNRGMSQRNGIGEASVKVCIKMLLKWGVFKKTYPSKSRKAELQRKLRKGYGRNRRYLRWRPFAKWRVPSCEDAITEVTPVWERCRGKKKQGPEGAP